jgi:ribosomal protein L40E
MSSATSIERKAAAPIRQDGHRDADASFRSWHFFLLASLMAATVAVLMSRQSRPEDLILLSLAIASAGVAAAGFYRMLAPLVSEESAFDTQPLSESARAALEREKALTLRSIKELEFDRAMGKLSARDFDEMAGRLRTRAVSLMKELDLGASGYGPLIERELSERLRRSGRLPVCAGCGTSNDVDAAFCKRCGSKLAPRSAGEAP